MAEKTIKARLIMKNDSAENWSKATNFIPKKGEIIVYNGELPKIKVGDGETKVNDLPFTTDAISTDKIDEICGGTFLSASEVEV